MREALPGWTVAVLEALIRLLWWRWTHGDDEEDGMSTTEKVLELEEGDVSAIVRDHVQLVFVALEDGRLDHREAEDLLASMLVDAVKRAREGKSDQQLISALLHKGHQLLMKIFSPKRRRERVSSDESPEEPPETPARSVGPSVVLKT